MLLLAAILAAASAAGWTPWDLCADMPLGCRSRQNQWEGRMKVLELYRPEEGKGCPPISGCLSGPI